MAPRCRVVGVSDDCVTGIVSVETVFELDSTREDFLATAEPEQGPPSSGCSRLTETISGVGGIKV